MIAWKFRLWRTAGAAAALGLAACGGEGGEGASTVGGGESGEGAVAEPETPPAAAAAGGGGEQGEAGAASAFAGLSGDQLTALRLQHLKGFVMAAETAAQAGEGEAAAVLVQQGLLEAYDVAPDQFGAFDAGPVRAAAAAGPDIAARLRAAHDAIDRAQSGLAADHAVLAARMIDIATGLYQGVVHEDYVDPIEYQHSHGAALSARDALARGAGELRRRDRRAYEESATEFDRFAALWPAADAPEAPAAYRDVLVQASRVRLALSPFL
ncbi:MAG: hypothetical protein R3C25_06435 [Hyphomonadaceae bacterium]